MNRLITRIAIITGTLLGVAASLAISPRPASADDGLYKWGFSGSTETCTGKCTSNGYCCRIVIVIPN